MDAQEIVRECLVKLTSPFGETTGGLIFGIGLVLTDHVFNIMKGI